MMNRLNMARTATITIGMFLFMAVACVSTHAIEVGMGVSESTDAKAAAIEAAGEASRALGDCKPKLVLVFHGNELIAESEKLLDGVASVFNRSIIYGANGYAPLTSETHQGQVAVLALGGQIKVTAAVAETSGEEDDLACGKQIGEALRQATQVDTRGRLLLLIGACHIPRNNTVVEGICSVLGEKAPVVGAAAFDGIIYVGGKKVEKSNLGLLITGKFTCGFALKQDNSPEGLITSAHDALKEAIGKNHKKTALALVFDCGGRRGKMLKNDNFPEELEAMKKAARQVPLFGFYGSGEMGRQNNDAAPCGVGYHISACAIVE